MESQKIADICAYCVLLHSTHSVVSVAVGGGYNHLGRVPLGFATFSSLRVSEVGSSKILLGA